MNWGWGEENLCLAFPARLLTSPLCIISPENIAPASEALLWPRSPRQCRRAVINVDTGPVSRAEAPLCVMNKTHLPLQTRLLGGISKTHNMLVSARAIPVSPACRVPVKPH